MSFKEKFNSMVNKVSDAVMDAQATFEKGCETWSAYSLKDLRDGDEVKVKRCEDENTAQFSGSLEAALKNVEKPWIFVDERGKYYAVDESDLKQQSVEVQLKSKSEKHIVTAACIKRVRLYIEQA